MADIHFKKTQSTLNNVSLLKTSVRYGSLWNGSFAGIFYALKFPGWRVDIQKLNCQLARNTVIPETGMFITFYGRSVTQIHWDALPVKPLPLYASVSNLETLREGWQYTQSSSHIPGNDLSYTTHWWPKPLTKVRAEHVSKNGAHVWKSTFSCLTWLREWCGQSGSALLVHLCLSVQFIY